MREIPVPLEVGRAGLHDIRIRWAEDHEGVYTARALRLSCPCAQCREELSGRPLLDPATVPDDVHSVRAELVGGYAIRFEWSDGHQTGIYTWEYLYAMCPCERCAGRRATARP